MNILRAAIAASMLALVSCGGGDDSSAGSPMPAPTPTPTPTPSPTPTPTPSAYVIPDYNSDFSLTSTLGYDVNFVEVTNAGLIDQYFASGALLADGKVSMMAYSRNPERADFSYDLISASYTAADRVPGLSYIMFQKGKEYLTPGLLGNTPARYVTTALRRTQTTNTTPSGVSSPGYNYQLALYGTPSSTLDPMPDFLGWSGLVIVRGGIPGTQAQSIAQVGGGASQVDWSFTPSADRLSGSIPLYVVTGNNQTQHGLLLAEGKFNRATNSVSGTLVDQMNGYRGSFRGQVFGPNRAELALIFAFSRESDHSQYYGHYIGR